MSEPSLLGTDRRQVTEDTQQPTATTDTALQSGHTNTVSRTYGLIGGGQSKQSNGQTKRVGV